MMKIRCKTIVSAAACLVLSACFPVTAQEGSARAPQKAPIPVDELLAAVVKADTNAPEAPALPPRKGTMPIEDLLAAVAKKTGKKFLVEPRVRADVLLIGEDVASIDYRALLTILSVHGLAAVEGPRYVRVTPDASIRQDALPLAGDEPHPDEEFVTKVVVVRNVSAAQLVPILRPLIPQQGHMVSMPCNNTLLIVDSFANVRRIEKIIQELDRGEPYVPPPCG